jgi:IclR family mhp operon transcriptional activator
MLLFPELACLQVWRGAAHVVLPARLRSATRNNMAQWPMAAPIQPVVRTLALLRALNHQPHSSLLELHCATGLPKPTVHRLLATLKAEGYVRGDVARGAYSLTAKVRELAEGFTEYELMIELGRPIVMRATRESGLPLAIGLLVDGRIVVRYSSMPYSPIAPEHTTLGHSHDLLESGMGQAYLTYCSKAERAQLEHQMVSTCPDDLTARELRRNLGAAIAQTRKRGYGLRRAAGPGETATLAVPIVLPDRLGGVLSLTTFGRLMDSRAIQDYITLLRQTSAQIAAAVSLREQG